MSPFGPQYLLRKTRSMLMMSSLSSSNPSFDSLFSTVAATIAAKRSCACSTSWSPKFCVPKPVRLPMKLVVSTELEVRSGVGLTVAVSALVSRDARRVRDCGLASRSSLSSLISRLVCSLSRPAASSRVAGRALATESMGAGLPSQTQLFNPAGHTHTACTHCTSPSGSIPRAARAARRRCSGDLILKRIPDADVGRGNGLTSAAVRDATTGLRPTRHAVRDATTCTKSS
mmetsp:Transcript_57800/g.95513  ORF Transcript_57800/g.95513 Transcript_57800/m.95513 type:complete len:230 (-) Transcript_57800:48-737(-)